MSGAHVALWDWDLNGWPIPVPTIPVVLNYADWPRLIFQVAFLNNPLDDPTLITWSDEADRVSEWTSQRGRPDQLTSFQAGTFTVTVDNQDGYFDPTFPESPFYGDAVPRKLVQLLAEYPVGSGNVYPIFAGISQSIAPTYQGAWQEQVAVGGGDWFSVLTLAPYNPNPPSIPPNPNVAQGAPACWGDQRIEDVLDYALPGVNGNLDSAFSHVQADQSLASGETITVLGLVQSGSSSALDMCQSVETTEGLGAAFYIAKDGTPTFENRYHRGTATRSTVVQAVFSDLIPGAPANASSTLIQYETITPSIDDSQLWTDAQVTDGLGATYDFSDTDDVTAYLDSQYTQSTIGDHVFEAYDYAAWVVHSTSQTPLRFELTVRPVFNSTNDWPQILGLEISDLVRIQRNPPSGNSIDVLAFVERISHNANPDDWSVTIGVSPIGLTQPNQWILGSGQLGTDTILSF